MSSHQRAMAAPVRVLVADDNADMRDYLSRLLTPQYDVEAVGDAVSAIDVMARRAPNLVLSDVMLPGRDGLELLKVIRSSPSTATVPVVLLSARAGEEAKVEGGRVPTTTWSNHFPPANSWRVESHLRLASLRAEVDAEREMLNAFLAQASVSRARSIVERHGGRITLTSIEGQGTTVAVHLPLAATPNLM